ncbi:TPA: hypothetical protein I7144_20645 [Vibrio vulnificus]|nr:hypothetical protein [Vibrio vulnificus]
MRKETFHIELNKGWEEPISFAEFNRLCDLVDELPTLNTQEVNKLKSNEQGARQRCE